VPSNMMQRVLYLVAELVWARGARLDLAHAKYSLLCIANKASEVRFTKYQLPNQSMLAGKIRPSAEGERVAEGLSLNTG